MPVTQVIRWQTTDGGIFETEDHALTHEILYLRREELREVLDPIWCRGIEKEDVIDVLLDNFFFTKKD